MRAALIRIFGQRFSDAVHIEGSIGESNVNFKSKTMYAVGEEADTFYASGRRPAVQVIEDVVGAMEEAGVEDSSEVVLARGALVNKTLLAQTLRSKHARFALQRCTRLEIVRTRMRRLLKLSVRKRNPNLLVFPFLQAAQWFKVEPNLIK